MTYYRINIIIIHRQGETHFFCVKRIRDQFPELRIAGSSPAIYCLTLASNPLEKNMEFFITRNLNGLAIIRSYFTGSFL